MKVLTTLDVTRNERGEVVDQRLDATKMRSTLESAGFEPTEIARKMLKKFGYNGESFECSTNCTTEVLKEFLISELLRQDDCLLEMVAEDDERQQPRPSMMAICHRK